MNHHSNKVYSFSTSLIFYKPTQSTFKRKGKSWNEIDNFENTLLIVAEMRQGMRTFRLLLARCLTFDLFFSVSRPKPLYELVRRKTCLRVEYSSFE